METIKCAAIRSGLHIICGSYHGECLRIAKDAGFPKPDQRMGQGFLTDKWRFVLRREALQIARDAEQIIKKHPPMDILLSEDLR